MILILMTMVTVLTMIAIIILLHHETHRGQANVQIVEERNVRIRQSTALEMGWVSGKDEERRIGVKTKNVIEEALCPDRKV